MLNLFTEDKRRVGKRKNRKDKGQSVELKREMEETKR